MNADPIGATLIVKKESLTELEKELRKLELALESYHRKAIKVHEKDKDVDKITKIWSLRTYLKKIINSEQIELVDLVELIYLKKSAAISYLTQITEFGDLEKYIKQYLSTLSTKESNDLFWERFQFKKYLAQWGEYVKECITVLNKPALEKCYCIDKISDQITKFSSNKLPEDFFILYNLIKTAFAYEDCIEIWKIGLSKFLEHIELLKIPATAEEWEKIILPVEESASQKTEELNADDAIEREQFLKEEILEQEPKKQKTENHSNNSLKAEIEEEEAFEEVRQNTYRM